MTAPAQLCSPFERRRMASWWWCSRELVIRRRNGGGFPTMNDQSGTGFRRRTTNPAPASDGRCRGWGRRRGEGRRRGRVSVVGVAGGPRLWVSRAGTASGASELGLGSRWPRGGAGAQRGRRGVGGRCAVSWASVPVLGVACLPRHARAARGHRLHHPSRRRCDDGVSPGRTPRPRARVHVPCTSAPLEGTPP